MVEFSDTRFWLDVLVLYLGTGQTNRASIGSEKMKLIVKKLCSKDPHQFFQRLETLARCVPVMCVVCVSLFICVFVSEWSLVCTDCQDWRLPVCPFLTSFCREYLLEVKVRLLEQLSCGFNSPQLAIEFIQMLLDEYSSLCNSLPALLYLLEPLVRAK